MLKSALTLRALVKVSKEEMIYKLYVENVHF